MKETGAYPIQFRHPCLPGGITLLSGEKKIVAVGGRRGRGEKEREEVRNTSVLSEVGKTGRTIKGTEMRLKAMTKRTEFLIENLTLQGRRNKEDQNLKRGGTLQV